LFDIPRLKGKQWLEPGKAIYPEDLDAWLKKTRVKLEPGDVVFIRTGRWARRAAKRNRWIFLVSAAPIPVNGGTGSPLNPIATF
jgi:kynurenine formamidase